MSIIYETKGRAREYFELAANLYSGCEHACVYCYGADVTRKDPKIFFNEPRPRDGVLLQLDKDAQRLAENGETRHILLSFVTDPYQPIEEKLKVTRRAIEIIHSHGLNVAILTKGGWTASRDFDLLTKKDMFGVSLTCDDNSTWSKFEPKTATPSARIMSLELAKDRGITTWASFEPVLNPDETLSLIQEVAEFCDVFKVGTLNYSNKLPRDLQDLVREIDWPMFAREVKVLLKSLGVNYYLKEDLRRYLS